MIHFFPVEELIFQFFFVYKGLFIMSFNPSGSTPQPVVGGPHDLNVGETKPSTNVTESGKGDLGPDMKDEKGQQVKRSDVPKPMHHVQ
jgi:hypothetical protein